MTKISMTNSSLLKNSIVSNQESSLDLGHLVAYKGPPQPIILPKRVVNKSTHTFIHFLLIISTIFL